MTLQDRDANSQVEKTLDFKNESTKQSEYDFHRSVATQCAHSKLKKIEIVLLNRLLNARYVVDVHNMDFNEISQGK